MGPIYVSYQKDARQTSIHNQESFKYIMRVQVLPTNLRRCRRKHRSVLRSQARQLGLPVDRAPAACHCRSLLPRSSRRSSPPCSRLWRPPTWRRIAPRWSSSWSPSATYPSKNARLIIPSAAAAHAGEGRVATGGGVLPPPPVGASGAGRGATRGAASPRFRAFESVRECSRSF